MATTLACCAAAMLGSAGEAAGGGEGRFLPLAPLAARDLFTERMRFKGGEPIVSIGLMEAQREVVVAGPNPLRLMFDEDTVPKVSYAPPASSFTLRVLQARPAVLRYWAVVDAMDYADESRAEALRVEWVRRGHDSRVFEVGTIVALRGKVLDTRQRLIAIGGLDDQKALEALISRLSQESNVRATLHEELVGLPSGTIGVYDAHGRLLHRAEDSVLVGTVEDGSLEIRNVEHGRGYDSHGRETRRYGGHIYVVIDRHGRLSVVNSIGTEKLLRGLVPAEIFANAPEEALKAQAVTARGAIFSKLAHRHFADPFHLCSEQHCQVYAGATMERKETDAAVLATRGLLAVRPKDGGRDSLELVPSVYSSSCGGFSESNEIVWDNAPSPSLRPRLDGPATDPALSAFSAGLGEANLRAWLEGYPPTFCARSSFARPEKFRWTKTVAGAALEAAQAKLGVGRWRRVEVLGRGPGGRVTGLRFEGEAGRADVLRELAVRRLFGNLNSGMFVFELSRGSDGFVSSLRFVGGGFGHGAGMCQIGAIGRAERGQSFEEILGHYYSGAVVERIYD